MLTIRAFKSLTDNDFTFDYKYTDNPISSAGINESNLLSSLAVYPNPTSSDLNIQLDKTYNDINICIVNLFGDLVFSEKFNDRDLINLNLEKLWNGVYILFSEADGKAAQQKLVIED